MKLEIPWAELFKHWQTRSTLGFVKEYFDSINLKHFLSQWFNSIFYYLEQKAT